MPFREATSTLTRRALGVAAVVMTLACLGLCLVAPAVAWADDVPQKTVRLGYVNVEGYEEGGPDEPKQGFGYEYFQKISYYANWDYEYVYGTFSDLIHMLERGEIDVLGDVTRSEEREGKMLFSQLPMGDEKFYLYCRADDERFHSSSIEQMKGVRIGVEGKKASAKLARDWAKTHNPSAVFVDCADSKVLNDSLDDGRVDLIVLTDFAEGFGYQPVQLLGNQDIYFAVTKSRPDLLNELNDALSVIQTSSPNYNATAKSRYVDGSVSSYLLGTREKKWLQDHGNHVTVGYLDDNLPYSDLDRAGYLQGYLSTMVEAMREEHGIDVDTVPFQNIKDMYQSFRKGEIDVYGPCYGSFYTSEFYGVMQTDRVAETQAAIIYSGSEPNTERIAVTNRSMLFDHMLSQRYPEAQIVLCDDVRACIHAVSSGQADCTFVPASQMSRMRLYHEFQSLNYVVTNLNLSMFFFVRQGNPGLLQIMDKCVVLVNRQQEGISYLPNSYADQEIALLDIIENNMGVVVAFVLVVAGVLAFALLRARRAQTRARAANEQLAVVNQDLARALELAESASQAKTRFLNSMSHDIRTPMNAVMGYATIARKRNQDAGVGDCLDKISSSSEHLLTLINDVLDTSRIESGKVVISPEPVDLGNVTQTVADIARGFIAGRDLDFQVNAAAAESTWALADAARIRDVLVNILGNAVKFTPDGGTVRFDFELLPGADESHVLARYRVADTGVGMSPEFLEHLFDEFSQEEQGARTSYKGTGLGMAIVKRYVDMMGGTVAVESTKGAGSTFTVELPLERCRQEDLEEPAQPATAVSLEGVRVLMAEDNDLNAEIATIQLEEAGMAVTRARDGQEALELFCNSQEGSFDAILMDVMMPRMDGHEATRAIRSLSRSDASLPIVAMTANAFAEDARACREAGMDDHLAKPMAMDQVLEVLGSCLGKRGHRMP